MTLSIGYHNIVLRSKFSVETVFSDVSCSQTLNLATDCNGVINNVSFSSSRQKQGREV